MFSACSQNRAICVPEVHKRVHLNSILDRRTAGARPARSCGRICEREPARGHTGQQTVGNRLWLSCAHSRRCSSASSARSQSHARATSKSHGPHRRHTDSQRPSTHLAHLRCPCHIGPATPKAGLWAAHKFPPSLVLVPTPGTASENAKRVLRVRLLLTKPPEASALCTCTPCCSRG